jgi:hypothetical protein
MKHPIVPFVFLATFCGVLIWRAGDDEQFVQPSKPSTMAALALPAPAQGERLALVPNTPLLDTAPWAHPDVMGELRSAYGKDDAAAWRAAIARALPVLATDQDVQLQVGDMLTSVGDPIDGLAWQLLACEHCTQTDERIGLGCAAAGLCDPNLELIDVRRRDYGEPMVAEALIRREQIKAAIASGDPAALAPFTELDDARIPPDPRTVGECVQLRTPTPECPPEEILRQTREAWREPQ